jgi:hypothetical protein
VLLDSLLVLTAVARSDAEAPPPSKTATLATPVCLPRCARYLPQIFAGVEGASLQPSNCVGKPQRRAREGDMNREGSFARVLVASGVIVRAIPEEVFELLISFPFPLTSINQSTH